MPDRNEVILLSGGHKGAEAEFGRCAERWGVREITYSFEGHQMEHSGEVRVLTPAELAQGDVSMEIVSQHMGRSYTSLEVIRRVIQSMYHVVAQSYEVYAVGWIQPDNTVMGGTGWGVELAKFFNRPVSVFDQDKHAWFTWKSGAWLPAAPTLPVRPFGATGTRRLTDSGREAIRDLFHRSLGPAPAPRARVAASPAPVPAARPAARPARAVPKPRATKAKAARSKLEPKSKPGRRHKRR